MIDDGQPRTVAPFRSRHAVERCVRCGSHFRRLAEHHTLCGACYWWARGLSHLAEADKAFARLRERGYR
jgi:hypothetical protein